MLKTFHIGPDYVFGPEYLQTIFEQTFPLKGIGTPKTVPATVAAVSAATKRGRWDLAIVFGNNRPIKEIIDYLLLKPKINIILVTGQAEGFGRLYQYQKRVSIIDALCPLDRKNEIQNAVDRVRSLTGSKRSSQSMKRRR